MNDSMAKATEDSVDNNTTRQNIRPLPVEKKPASLSDQWSVLEKYDREFRERFRKERQEILAKYDRDVVEITNAYREKIENTIAMLEQDKKQELLTLAHETAVKLSEHELLAKRMG